MDPLKVGLAGCGRIARLVHLKILGRLRGVEVMAVAEPDPAAREHARRLAPAAALVADYHDLLAKPELEAVIICLPPALHAEAAVAALQSGKHVYLEKPLAISLEEGRRVLEAWRRRDGLVGMMGFNYRFHAIYEKARRWLESGRLGRLASARSRFLSAPRPLPEWKQKRESGGGALLDLGSHHVDLIHFLFGQRVREVSCDMESRHSEGDAARLEIQLVGGPRVRSFFSLDSTDEDRFEISGDTAKLSLDRHRCRWELAPTNGSPAGRGRPYWLLKLLAPSTEPSYREALTYFVAAVRGRRPARPDFEDGYRSLAVITAAEESARTGRPVQISDENPAAS